MFVLIHIKFINTQLKQFCINSAYADMSKLDELYQARKIGINDQNIKKYIKDDILKDDYELDNKKSSS